MKKIPLTSGDFAIIDKEDIKLLGSVNWYYTSSGRCFYVSSKINKRKIYLHRLISGASKGQVVDHINGDTLDNRKSNLRICSNKENVRSQHKYRLKRGKSSKYRGVYWCKKSSIWRSTICVDYNVIKIGKFLSEEEAAIAYNDYAIKYFKEFAILNEIENHHHQGEICTD